ALAKKKKAKFDPNGTYQAAMGIQTCTLTWINRMAYFDKGLNPAYENDDFATLFAADPAGDSQTFDGEFTDVELAGNGTYTVTLTGADFAGETDISQLYVTTNIPKAAPVTFSDVSFTVNGKEIATFEEGFMEDEDKYLEGGKVLLCINHWRPELVSLLKEQGVQETTTGGGGCPLLKGATGEEISITFTVAGFDYDNEAAVAEDETSSEDTATSGGDSTTTNVTTTTTSEEKKSVNPVIPIGIGAGVVVVVVIVLIISRKKS
ncbi:MAG: hypothetical protein K6G11_04450, partial [Lachnospiraceae bacterium]|nr:hypothetical protein [Lachnospiraceae bacterium]